MNSVAIAVVGAASLVASADAGFVDGQTISATWYSPNLTTPFVPATTWTAGPSPTFEYRLVQVTDGYRVTLRDSTIRFDFFHNQTESIPFVFWVSAPFNGWMLRDLGGTVDDFASLTLGNWSGSTNWSAVTLGASADELSINFGTMAQSPIHNGDWVDFRIGFVPSPGVLTTALGLVVRCHSRRRRK
jgi:hypothetical protein